METSPAYAASLTSYGDPHPDGYLTAEAVAAYALGAGAFCYWLWRQQRTGSEQTHSSIISAWGQPALGYDNVRAASAARLRIEPHMLNTRPLKAEVAITYSDRAKAFLATEPHRQLNYRSLLGDFYRRILDLGIHRDLLPEGGDLSGYKLLFTPLSIICHRNTWRRHSPSLKPAASGSPARLAEAAPPSIRCIQMRRWGNWSATPE